MHYCKIVCRVAISDDSQTTLSPVESINVIGVYVELENEANASSEAGVKTNAIDECIEGEATSTM